MSGSDLRDVVLAIILAADTLVFGLMMWRWLSSAPVMAFITRRGHILAAALLPRQPALPALPAPPAAHGGFDRSLARG